MTNQMKTGQLDYVLFKKKKKNWGGREKHDRMSKTIRNGTKG